jgi:hypothetical protein
MKALHGFLARSAAYLVFATVLVSSAPAQQQPAPRSDATAASATPVDPKAHEAAIRLTAALGLKEKMAARIDTLLTQGVANMKSEFPNIRPEFTEEWQKRMKARVNPDDFIAVVVQVYEKYLTAAELDQITEATNQSKEGKIPVLSDAVKEKYQKNAVAMQSEILGGCAQLGAKLGGEVGEEIAKEHPDWNPTPAPKSAK